MADRVTKARHMIDRSKVQNIPSAKVYVTEDNGKLNIVTIYGVFDNTVVGCMRLIDGELHECEASKHQVMCSHKLAALWHYQKRGASQHER